MARKEFIYVFVIKCDEYQLLLDLLYNSVLCSSIQINMQQERCK